ncbi:hypothetical protein GPK34_00500 [Secundilactobacillus kimchicus]|uniref:hypothetical protein n=1 Tax=Secundilactobacillus kimchicus TaxID=528209 RepID=UPI001C00B47D|nr:hypothetical protein [Secundilactobacillus kimchicus]MBT9670517.1 hypothetical protein [Secundilactobacillus kimchicus]
MENKINEIIANWSNATLDDDSRIYETKQVVNQLVPAVSEILNRAIYADGEPISNDTDWSTLDGHAVYAYKSLTGKNAPDKTYLKSDDGYIINVNNVDNGATANVDTVTAQIVISTSGGVAIRTFKNGSNGTWFYVQDAKSFKEVTDSVLDIKANMLMKADLDTIKNEVVAENKQAIADEIKTQVSSSLHINGLTWNDIK